MQDLLNRHLIPVRVVRIASRKAGIHPGQVSLSQDTNRVCIQSIVKVFGRDAEAWRKPTQVAAGYCGWNQTLDLLTPRSLL